MNDEALPRVLPRREHRRPVDVPVIVMNEHSPRATSRPRNGRGLEKFNQIWSISGIRRRRCTLLKAVFRRNRRSTQKRRSHPIAYLKGTRTTLVTSSFLYSTSRSAGARVFSLDANALLCVLGPFAQSSCR